MRHSLDAMIRAIVRDEIAVIRRESDSLPAPPRARPVTPRGEAFRAFVATLDPGCEWHSRDLRARYAASPHATPETPTTFGRLAAACPDLARRPGRYGGSLVYRRLPAP